MYDLILGWVVKMPNNHKVEKYNLNTKKDEIVFIEGTDYSYLAYIVDIQRDYKEDSLVLIETINKYIRNTPLKKSIKQKLQRYCDRQLKHEVELKYILQHREV